MKTAKYRPCFTSEHISHIYLLCKKDLSDTSLSVLAVLVPFKAKIENSCITPAYTVKVSESLCTSLGIGNDDEYSYLTPPEKRERAFNKWSENPNLCNVSELELAQDFRVENDLLSLEEVERINAEWVAKYGYLRC